MFSVEPAKSLCFSGECKLTNLKSIGCLAGDDSVYDRNWTSGTVVGTAGTGAAHMQG